ncbi:MAG TPA: hypothetical protein VNA27_13530 [Rubrobacteraceae bacterium]|nr:hypothetical protein [Rubrobacteraceae bacterium]
MMEVVPGAIMPHGGVGAVPPAHTGAVASGQPTVCVVALRGGIRPAHTDARQFSPSP